MANRLRLPDTLASITDPVGPNPFPVETVQHKVWEEATRKAEEEICRLNAEGLSSLTPETALLDWLPSLVAAKFDVWAKRTIQVVWTDGAVRGYDRLLIDQANSWIDTVSQFLERDPPRDPVEPVLLSLRNRLAARVEHWRAEARGYRAAQEAHAQTEASTNATVPGEGRVGGPRLAAWLKAEMRKRKNITRNHLHVLTDLDRKTIKAMLDAKPVARVRLEKLASGLGVSVSEIPTD
jgi:hypothetical protein